MGQLFIDTYGHEVPPAGPNITGLTAGAVSTSAAGTISPTTSAGGSPTVSLISNVTPTDRRGSFNLNPVTGGGAQAAGQVCLVRFKQAYGAIPSAVICNITNDTDSTAAIVCSAKAITAAGFDIYVGTALTTAKVYLVNYVVIP